MLKITTLPIGYLQTNCYILTGDSGCLVIDPASDADRILEALNGKPLAAVLLTHGHFDHVGAVKNLVAETGCPVYLCEQELSLPRAITSGPLYYTHTYGEGDELTLAGLTFTVLHTPGHTPGSVCLCFGDQMFAGDTLFAGSIGRTDLPDGDSATMLKTLHRLAGLETDYTVHPGHGESTTLAEEKRYNPYLR